MLVLMLRRRLLLVMVVVLRLRLLRRLCIDRLGGAVLHVGEVPSAGRRRLPRGSGWWWRPSRSVRRWLWNLEIVEDQFDASDHVSMQIMGSQIIW